MITIRRLSSALLPVFALLVGMPALARDWLRAELPGVVLYSDGYPHEMQRWALRLRLFDALLRAELGLPGRDGDPGSPLTIYLLEDNGDIEELTGRDNLNGLYSPSSEGSFLIASRAPGYERTRLSGQMTLFHEYAHHLMYRHFSGTWPAWYREGYAEYAGAVTFDADWNARVGLPAWPRLRHLEGKPMPLATILTATVDDLPAGQRTRFYAWSWKLVHMLEAAPGDRERLDEYLRLFASGIASIEAARQSFGDLAVLESRLHAPSPPPFGGRTVKPTTGAVPDIAVETLNRSASRLVDLRLARIAGPDPAAAARALQVLARDDPRSSEAWRELALAETAIERKRKRGADYGMALAHARTAAMLAPDDLRAIAVESDIATRQLARDMKANPESWRAARARLEIAVDPMTRDPYALAILFRSYLAERRRPPAAAHAAIARAIALQPESYEIRLLDVYSLAMLGRGAEARQAARSLASDPHAADVGRRALALIDGLTPP